MKMKKMCSDNYNRRHAYLYIDQGVNGTGHHIANRLTFETGGTFPWMYIYHSFV